MSVTSVLRLPVRRGAEADLVRAFEELRVFVHAGESGGFRCGRLLRPLAPDEPFVVLAEWDGAADYDRWLENPIREHLKDTLEPLLDGEPEGALYEEAHEG